MSSLLKKSHVSRILSGFLVAILVLTIITPVLAETVTKDGISVTVETDKDEYTKGEEVKITVTFKNTGDVAVDYISAKVKLPEGLVLPEGVSDTISIGTLDAGAEKTETITATATDDVKGDDIDGEVTTGDSNTIVYMVVLAAAAVAALVLIRRKNYKSAGTILTVAVVLIGASMMVQTAMAASVSGQFDVTKAIKLDGENAEIVVTVSYGEKTADIDVTASYKRASVHDPSIIKDPATGIYYVFGSHMAWAKSDDLINWTTFTNNINTDFETLFADEFTWSKKASRPDYDPKGNLWAPDVIWNEAMGKWCMYMSLNGQDWNSTISLLTADSLDGDWEYVGPVIQSGMSKGYGVTFDYTRVTGETTPATRYTDQVRNNNPLWEPHAIDPCVIYDEEGNLWMSYGSWSGGISMIRLDNETGLRDYTVTYSYDANNSDPYTGYRIAGGNAVSGEASYIQKIDNYYYLFMSYGGLVANGGYSMRVFRSESINGPYVDESGDDARYPMNGGVGSTEAGNINGSVGVKLMTYYQWSYASKGQVAQGHNSAFVDVDGKAYVVYHTRTNDGTEGHQVRVHQLFTNKDGWLVAAPYEYTGETISDTGYSETEMTGTYEVLFHKQSINYTGLECVTAQALTLNADGTVTGDYTGTWSAEAESPYVTMVLGGVEYNGVFVKQYMEDTKYETMCFTILGDNEVEMWGSKYLTGKDAVDLTIAAGKSNPPEVAVANIDFAKEGLYGTTITYESSNTDVIANDGTITKQSTNTDVVVTATYTNGTYAYSKDYTITVMAGPGEDGRILLKEYYIDAPINLSNAAEGTYRVANPFNKATTAGLEIYNGVSIEFDVEGEGPYLSTLLSFNSGDSRMFFTGGSYLGYNATGGFFDANVTTGDSWAAGTDYIKGKATIRIDIDGTGFKVYADGNLAYDQTSVNAGATLTSYANMLLWLNNTAETMNFGWGAFWADKFNGTISNVKLYANEVEEIDTSEYVYYQDYSKGDISEWTSLSALGALGISNDGNARGQYLKFAAGADGGNRGAYAVFNESANVSGKYTISLETSLTAGVLTQRSESVFAILGTDAAGYTGNAAVTSGYILKLRNVPPAGTAANQTNTTLQDKWYINDTETVVTIPVGTWVKITANVDTAAGTVAVVIADAQGNALYNGTVNINGSGELYGLQILRGRGIGTASVDSITVKSNGEAEEPEVLPNVNAAVTGTAYPDKDSTVTVTFTGDKDINSTYPVVINGTTVTTNSQVGMAKVESITRSGATVTVNLKIAAIAGWHSVIGSYDVELKAGTTSLAKKNVSYSLDISGDTDYTSIDTVAANEFTKGYFKVVDTKLYVMTIIKTDKIHCDAIQAGETTYGWWNGINSEARMTIDGTLYNVGSHVYNAQYANPITWGEEAVSTLILGANAVRSYMALGTFDDDTDTDTGCILLNVVDLADIGLSADDLSGKVISFSGLFGPNDGGTRLIGIDSAKTYTLN